MFLHDCILNKNTPEITPYVLIYENNGMSIGIYENF